MGEKMRASAIEFRLRMPIQIVIVLLGFWSPWVASLDLSRRVSTLAWLPLLISRFGLLRFTYATPVVIVAGALVAALGALLRVWGAAYLGYGTVHHANMQASSLMADGPYRYVRNPLYLGGWCMMIGMSLLMPPTGALLVIISTAFFYLRLIFGEEAFLRAKLGDPYQNYLRAVPRLFPRLRTSLPAAGNKPHWWIAAVSEVQPIGVFFTLACLSWTYDNLLMIKSIVICFGASLVIRAIMPRTQINSEEV
jgi:protein-S-isoprenylcysteine O-methyltransferase Ste14